MNNDRAGAGFSPNSYRKHRRMELLIASQAHAYRVTHPRARILLIDTNAGDGHGVREPQMNFFEDEVSQPSPLVLADLYGQIGAAGLIVCEQNRKRRESLEIELKRQVPQAVVLADNRDLIGMTFEAFDWALVVSDPCGYSQRNGKGHPLEVLQYIMGRVSSDAILTFNRGALARHLAVGDEPGPYDNERITAVRKTRHEYEWMDELSAWASRLGRRRAARSRVVSQSSNYKFQLIVVANYLADRIQRNRRDWEIYGD
jgi:hypothetical protein